MKFFLFLIPAAVAVGMVAGTIVGTPREMEISAGARINIPCSLKGAQLAWYWIPRYPICAGMEGRPKEIFLMTSSTFSFDGDGNRFQKPSSVPLQETNRSINLTVKFLHMKDSGTYYCSNGKDTSSKISVIVKSDNRSGMIVEASRGSPQGKQSVMLTCKTCEDKWDTKTGKSTTITWTINGQNASDHVLRHLRAKVIVEKSPQNYGLWKCSHPTCPMQFDGYCLEDEFRTSENSEIEKTSWSTPTPLDATKKFNFQIIGGCVIGLLTLLWIGAVIFALQEKLRSRRISSSRAARKPNSQGIKNSVGVDKHLKKQEKEKDVEMDEGEIQYSELQFNEFEPCQVQKDKATPTVIYAEMPASNCSRS